MGSITETATSAPGNSSLRPNTKAPLAMTLKLNGYSTAQFGKCHEVPVWQSSPIGPFDAWPSAGGGFETFYGFIGGENNQWDPALYNPLRHGRSCAWMAVIATVLTMSRTSAPRERSLTGLRRPCRTGPTARAPAERCTAL